MRQQRARLRLAFIAHRARFGSAFAADQLGFFLQRIGAHLQSFALERARLPGLFLQVLGLRFHLLGFVVGRGFDRIRLRIGGIDQLIGLFLLRRLLRAGGGGDADKRQCGKDRCHSHCSDHLRR